MANLRQTGSVYEERAARWLEDRGFRILERNYRCRQGEIDLIARDGKYLVFVEVKYRKGQEAGHPAEAVGVRKQKRIILTALYYCTVHGVSETQACRFDVVSIQGETIEYIENAFEM